MYPEIKGVKVTKNLNIATPQSILINVIFIVFELLNDQPNGFSLF